jgi:hypothetical protein
MKENREFRVELTALIQRARTLHGHFLNNIAGFTNYNPGMDATYAAAWVTAIDDCEVHPTDETTVDQLQQYTSDVEEAHKACFAAANLLEGFVKDAFPNDTSIMEEFGFTERKMARARKFNLLIWMEIMKRIANDYAAELAAVGMPAGVLTNLDLRQQNAVNAELEQEYYKRIRKRLARQRLQKFNSLYRTCTRVRDAAESVFAQDKERKGLFVV